MCFQAHTHTHALRSKKQTNKQISCRCTHLSCIWHLTLERPSRVPLMRHWKRQRERETEWDRESVRRGKRRRCVRASSVQYAYRFHNNNYGLLLLGKCISHLLFPSYSPPFTSPCTLLKFAFLFWDNSPCVDFWFVILCIRFHLSGQSNYYAWHSALPSLLGFPFPLSSFLLFLWTAAAHLLRTRFPAPCGKREKSFECKLKCDSRCALTARSTGVGGDSLQSARQIKLRKFKNI